MASELLLTASESELDSDAPTEQPESDEGQDFNKVLAEPQPIDTLPLPHWDDGLSPSPLFSFYHVKKYTRHWSKTPMGERFICSYSRTNNHKRGGNLCMDIKGGVCAHCVTKAQQDPTVKWREYVAQDSTRAHPESGVFAGSYRVSAVSSAV